MKILLCILIGYLIGSLNPAALLSKLKKKDLRKQGTGNLGATNTMIVWGKGYGALVMLFDVAKAFASVKLAQLFFADLAVAGLLAGSAAVIGHIYPFYLKFQGGKGLAAFGGMILAVDPLLFIILLVIALTLMLVINYSVAMPISAAVLFPILYGIRVKNLPEIIISIAICLLIMIKHYSNIQKAKNGDDIKVRDYIKDHLFH